MKLQQDNVSTPVCDSAHGRGGLCPGVSVQVVSVQRDLCPGGLCPGKGFCVQGGLCSGVSVQGSLSVGWRVEGSLSRGFFVRETPTW